MKVKIYYLITIVLILSAESLLLRNLIADKKVYLWMPRYEVLIENLTRLKTYVSFGLPGLGALLYFKNSKCKLYSSQIELVFLTGLICAILLSLFSIFAAYSDGRHIWLSYPFTISLSVAYFRDRSIKHQIVPWVISGKQKPVWYNFFPLASIHSKYYVSFDY